MLVLLLCFKSLRPFLWQLTNSPFIRHPNSPRKSAVCLYIPAASLWLSGSTFPCSTLLLFHIFQSFLLISSLLTLPLPCCASFLQKKIVSGDVNVSCDGLVTPPGCFPVLYFLPVTVMDPQLYRAFTVLTLLPIRHIISKIFKETIWSTNIIERSMFSWCFASTRENMYRMLTAMLKTQDSDAFKDTNGKMDIYIQVELGWTVELSTGGVCRWWAGYRSWHRSECHSRFLCVIISPCSQLMPLNLTS